MNTHNNLADLDELVLLCRDAKARDYIREAVACYKAGAFRAGIVATWIAVVFDILHKLEELELTGDKNAKAKLEEFSKIVAGGEGKMKEALEFERNILEFAAKDFELLTPQETIDLRRLQQDRNRCAHPNMQSAGSPYSPSAELARNHIRNAVDTLLAREPVQGKAAFDRIDAEVASAYFPLETSAAIEHFKTGPLARARDSLVRNLLVAFTKAFLNDDALAKEHRQRLLAAVGAIVQMHRKQAETVLSAELPKIVGALDDKRYEKFIELAWKVPESWAHAGPAAQGKARRYLESGELAGQELLRSTARSLLIPALEHLAVSRARKLPPADLGKCLSVPELREKLKGIIPSIIEDLADRSKVGSFRGAERFFENVVSPIATVLTAPQVAEVLQAVKKNCQVYDAGGIPPLLGKLFTDTSPLRYETDAQWESFAGWVSDERTKGMIGTSYSALFSILRGAGLAVPGEEKSE